MQTTVQVDDDSAVVTLERFYVSLDALRGFVPPADWARCARNYYRPTGRDPVHLLYAMIGGALSFAAQGNDDLAMASLWQALTMIKDAVPDDDDDQDDDDAAGCEGHESLAGEHMGETVFCDGMCQR